MTTKTARHAHDRMTGRVGLPSHLVHVLERKAKGLRPGAEYYMPLRRGSETLGFAVFGVYGGRPVMKTVLAPHMRPRGEEMKEFQVKTGDMIKTGAFDAGVSAGMVKAAYGGAAGAAIGGIIGALGGAGVAGKKKRKRGALVGGLLGAAGGYGIGRSLRMPKFDITRGVSEDTRRRKEQVARATKVPAVPSTPHPLGKSGEKKRDFMDAAKSGPRQGESQQDFLKGVEDKFNDFMASGKPLDLRG